MSPKHIIDSTIHILLSRTPYKTIYLLTLVELQLKNRTSSFYFCQYIPAAAPNINYSFYFVLPPHLEAPKFYVFHTIEHTLHVVDFSNKVNKRERTMIKGLYIAFIFYFY